MSDRVPLSYIVLAVSVRVGIALLTRSYFQPDEYFQSLEVAHHLMFGYGHLTWEWLSETPIRSILYPALNVPLYWTLKTLQLDQTSLVIWAPRILHGLFASCTDIWLYALAGRVLGIQYVDATYFLSITSFFNALSLSRSLSNSLETSLTTIALSYYPWHLTSTSRGSTLASLAFAALACVVRPTNALIWTFMFSMMIWRIRHDSPKLRIFVLDVMLVAVITVVAIISLDTLYYGKLTFTPLNFLLTNMSSVSLFYGSNPWHYYVLQALPILCTTALPFALHGAWIASKQLAFSPQRIMLGLVVWTLIIYSAAGHKEWRFIHPLLPILHLLAAKSLVDSSCIPGQKSTSIRRSFKWLILLPVPAIVYIVWFHARAQMDVMYYLRSLPAHEVKSLGFLMPCHSTPWQAYLHRPEWSDESSYWSIGCEPPLAGQDLSEYKDQAGIFLDSPVKYFQARFPPQVDPTFPPSSHPFSIPGARTQLQNWSHEWPQYIVMFGVLLEKPGVRGYLTDKGYAVVWEEEYGWDGDGNRQGGVKVWKYEGQS